MILRINWDALRDLGDINSEWSKSMNPAETWSIEFNTEKIEFQAQQDLIFAFYFLNLYWN